MANTIVSSIDLAIKEPWVPVIQNKSYILRETKPLKSIDLKGKEISDTEYKTKLKKLQKELKKLENVDVNI